MVSPTAMAWPPNCSTWAALRSSIWNRLMPGTDRPEPFNRTTPCSFSSMVSRMAGRPKRSTTREARIPRTPGWHRSCRIVRARRPARTWASPWARISGSQSCSSCLRCAFSSSRACASWRAVCSSRASSSSTPRSGTPSRPQALMRGASLKLMSSACTGTACRSHCSQRESTPGRVFADNTSSPARTSTRFTSTSGTTSATVPRATRSR